MLPKTLRQIISKFDRASKVFRAFALPPRNRNTVIAIVALTLIATTLFLTGNILGQLTLKRTIGSQGAVKTVGLGVYWDSGCNNAVYYVYWGTVHPGLARDVSFYVRNEGNDPIIISLNAENWSPINTSNYLTLCWDYSGTTLPPNATVQVTLTLLASQQTINIADFSFDIVINAASG